MRGRDFPPPLVFRRIIDLPHDFGVKQEGKGLNPVDYNPETSYQDISYAIVRKSSIRPSFESLDLTQRPKMLEATYLATICTSPQLKIPDRNLQPSERFASRMFQEELEITLYNVY